MTQVGLRTFLFTMAKLIPRACASGLIYLRPMLIGLSRLSRVDQCRVVQRGVPAMGVCAPTAMVARPFPHLLVL